VIYNEGWGQLPSAPELYLTPMLESLDPTRLVNSVTGWNDHGAGDYLDNHHVRDDSGCSHHHYHHHYHYHTITATNTTATTTLLG
jgi:hypothetical protein